MSDDPASWPVQLETMRPSSTTVIVGDPHSRGGTLGDAVTSSGGRALVVASAEAALGLMMLHAVDCIVTTTDLPGMTALELLDELRGRPGPPVVIVMTTRRDARTAAGWIEKGAADCVAAGEHAEIIAARCRAIVRRFTRAALTTKSPLDQEM